MCKYVTWGPYDLNAVSLPTGINQMRIMSMSEVVAEESTFVKNVESAAKSQACSKNISALILMSGLMYASCAILPSKLKVLDFFAELLPLLKQISSYSAIWDPRKAIWNQGENFLQIESIVFMYIGLHERGFFLYLIHSGIL